MELGIGIFVPPDPHCLLPAPPWRYRRISGCAGGKQWVSGGVGSKQ